MAALFTKDYFLIWAAVLALALFFPVRQLLWALYVRRAAGKRADIDEAESLRLTRRAGTTSGLLCFIFSILYTMHLFEIG